MITIYGAKEQNAVGKCFDSGSTSAQTPTHTTVNSTINNKLFNFSIILFEEIKFGMWSHSIQLEFKSFKINKTVRPFNRSSLVQKREKRMRVNQIIATRITVFPLAKHQAATHKECVAENRKDFDAEISDWRYTQRNSIPHHPSSIRMFRVCRRWNGKNSFDAINQNEELLRFQPDNFVFGKKHETF